ALVARFGERVGEYRARVHDATAESVDEVVGRLLASRRVLVPAAPPCAVDGFSALADAPPLTARELDGADAVLTGCALAVAETGTIVLDGSPACGRRALTLVPDHHVCVVRAEQIVADVPDAIAALRRTGATDRPITLVSGPSATSDIELERVEGVHGPRRLDVVVVK
ncbi:MAG: L-lactate dehydrogenase complex protein LldG, partial [Solirubrobacteraceae bacterium]|nr:L-lactate dehydrogenase complex protein LldG [Solirubrobacteraceae bacterium]